MARILTLTLNPALDLSVSLESLVPISKSAMESRPCPKLLNITF